MSAFFGPNLNTLTCPVRCVAGQIKVLIGGRSGRGLEPV